MREIPLTHGRVTLVDDEDFELVNQYKWHVRRVRDSTIYYAARSITKPKHQLVTLHRFLLQPPKGFVIDHINRDGLDNRRCNLRVATYSQNGANRVKAENTLSVYKGVSFHKSNKKWCAKIYLNQKQIWLGYFKDEIEAAKAYDVKAKELFGEFARLNLEEGS